MEADDDDSHACTLPGLGLPLPRCEPPVDARFHPCESETTPTPSYTSDVYNTEPNSLYITMRVLTWCCNHIDV
jgi:hypothetical protein